uniref:CARD domain-containing protein n=1 Tax=Astyanax mexicanus TaxID=7994 RepID=A0A8B9KK58_ASTMX
MMEEKEIKEKLEKEMKNSLRKIEGTVQEHEGEIKELNNRTTELERRMKEERDEEKKRELERELERKLERRTEMEDKLKRLKREMEEKHRQEMEEIRKMYKGEVRIKEMGNQKNFVFEKEYQGKEEYRGVLKKWLFTKQDQGVKSEEELSGDSKSKPSYTDAAELLSADTKLFIPEETEVTSGDGTTTCYRFQCPHAGLFQCKITSLVFEMKEKGEVLYRIVSWDARLLDGLGQMQPAGPLYDIDCKGLISHLYLPHCEILSDESQQSVAHFTAGNVEIIPPLRVTTTHVIIRIQALSLFGLLRNLFSANPISGQVLLFHKKLSVRQRMSKLNIHLLPMNVPVEEVMKKHPSSKYIDTSSKCQLTPGRKYRPSCDPYISQPEDETFECDYGPNYHPTFEVFIDIDAEDAKIGLLDEDEQEVWKPRLVFLTDISTQEVKLQTEAEWAAFVDDHREQLIQRVSSVMEILDCLEKQKMISKEMYDNIKVTKPPQEQMRMLYNVLHSGGRAVKVEFYKILKKKQQLLVDELEAGPSQA